MTFLILSGLLILPLTLFAGGTLGNGGNTLICPDKVTLLDFYEASSLRNITITEGSSQNSLDYNIQLILTKISHLDAPRALKYQKQWASFLNETLFVANTNLGTIDDSDHVYIPQNCKIQQTAIKLIQRFAQDPKYVIDLDTWNQMDSVQQAGLVLHEFIYSEMNHSTSQKARYYNSLLWSDLWHQLNAEEYQSLLQQVGLKP